MSEDISSIFQKRQIENLKDEVRTLKDSITRLKVTGFDGEYVSVEAAVKAAADAYFERTGLRSGSESIAESVRKRLMVKDDQP